MKILIVSPQLNSKVIHNHIESLKSMGYEIIVVTSQNQKEYAPVSTDTRFFFKRWNVLESAQFLPLLFSIRPQLIHFLVDDLNLNFAQELILEASKLFRLPVYTHFFNLSYEIHKNKNIKLFIYKSDLVTCAHRENLLDLRGLSTINKKQVRGVIPPLIKINRINSINKQEIKSSTINQFPVFPDESAIIPFKKDFFDEKTHELQLIKKILSHSPCIFVGNNDSIEASKRKKLNHTLGSLKVKNNWHFLHTDSLDFFWNDRTKKSKVIIAGFKFSTSELAEIFQFAIKNDLILVMDDFQAELYSGLWEHKVNSFILSRYSIFKELDNFFVNNDSYQFILSPYQNNLLQKELIDAPVNEFNRLIKKVLSLKYEYKI